MKFHSDLFGWQYVWRNFADAKGGTVITETAAEDSALVSMTVSVPLGETDKSATLLIAPAVLHGNKSTGIKVVAPFEALDDFTFCIFPESLKTQFGKVVGMQDIKVMDQLFDSKFLIQGNHPGRVADMFDNVNLRELLLLQPPARLAIETKTAQTDKKKTVPTKYHAVVYQFDGHVDKLHQIETSVEIVTSILEHVLMPYDGQSGSHAVVETEDEVDGATTQGKRLRSPLLDR